MGVGRSEDSLRVEGLSVEYGGGGGVRHVGLRLGRGWAVCLLGANGAGKTTLLRAIASGEAPRRGRIAVAGAASDSAAGRAALGFCPQWDALVERLSGAENVGLALQLRGLVMEAGSEERLLERLGLFGSGGVVVRELSGGSRRKVSVALALVGGPRMVVLDEPAAGVDVRGRRRICACLMALRRIHDSTLFLSTHCLDVVEEMAEEVVVLRDGRKSFSGSLGELVGSGREKRLWLLARDGRRREELCGRVCGEAGWAVREEGGDPQLLQYRLEESAEVTAATLTRVQTWMTEGLISWFQLSDSALERSLQTSAQFNSHVDSTTL